MQIKILICRIVEFCVFWIFCIRFLAETLLLHQRLVPCDCTYAHVGVTGKEKGKEGGKEGGEGEGEGL